MCSTGLISPVVSGAKTFIDHSWTLWKRVAVPFTLSCTLASSTLCLIRCRYDWRRSANEAVESLYEFLQVSCTVLYCSDLCFSQGIHELSLGRKIQLVGHSNGGVVIFAMFNKYRPHSMIHSIVLAGCPFKGGISLLEKINRGAQLGKNKWLFRSSAVCSFPSFYAYFLDDPKVVDVFDEDGKRVEINLYDAETWRKHRFGLFQDAWRLPQTKERYFRFLEYVLEDGLKFKALAAPVPGLAYPPVKVITSDSHPTGTGGVLRRGRLNFHTELHFYHQTKGGDGLVGPEHAHPPGVKAETYFTEMDHMNLLSDINVVSKSLSACFQSRRMTVSL